MRTCSVIFGIFLWEKLLCNFTKTECQLLGFRGNRILEGMFSVKNCDLNECFISEFSIIQIRNAIESDSMNSVDSLVKEKKRNGRNEAKEK